VPKIARKSTAALVTTSQAICDGMCPRIARPITQLFSSRRAEREERIREIREDEDGEWRHHDEQHRVVGDL